MSLLVACIVICFSNILNSVPLFFKGKISKIQTMDFDLISLFSFFKLALPTLQEFSGS